MPTGIFETDLTNIALFAVEREEENEAFRSFLEQRDTVMIDEKVAEINLAVSGEIDCTACGNCCRKLMISILPQEEPFFAEHFQLPAAEAREKYLSGGLSGDHIMTSMPCVFLAGNRCSIYSSRFTDCSAFPHLDKPGFTRRLWSTLTNYGICPIIFNVVENLKTEVDFRV
jgi:hypothetical protein